MRRLSHKLAVFAIPASLVAIPFAATAQSSAAVPRHFYTSALYDDPVLAKAQALTLQAAEEATEANAPLLPEATLRSERGRQGNGPWVTSIELRIAQSLVNREALSTLAAARARAQAAVAEGDAARQDLLLRAASAWTLLDVRRQERQFAIADRDALAFQAARSQARFEVGLAPRIDAVETGAQQASAVARILTADVALDDARQAVTQIARSWTLAKQEDASIHRLWPIQAPRVVAPDHEPFAVTAARHRLNAANHARRAAQAARWPTLSLQLRYGRSSIATNKKIAPTPFRRRPSLILGLQVTMPLMGTAIASANVRRANAQWDAAAAELGIATRDATRSIRRLERAQQSNESIVHARQSAEAASRASVEATRAGLDTGTRTTVDALLSQRRLLDARRATANATATQFLDRLSLFAARGMLEATDLERPPTGLNLSIKEAARFPD
ncbi:TolC family protein [Pinirhizobacter soli]|uniref:TolC family protein n=1 Tax=Pinirhizobacter soli TaxID=2786953 RepID=UPI002029D4AA|nr:TolC family protein [Pinirhizobacter soli]